MRGQIIQAACLNAVSMALGWLSRIFVPFLDRQLQPHSVPFFPNGQIQKQRNVPNASRVMPMQRLLACLPWSTVWPCQSSMHKP